MIIKENEEINFKIFKEEGTTSQPPSKNWRSTLHNSRLAKEWINKNKRKIDIISISMLGIHGCVDVVVFYKFRR